MDEQKELNSIKRAVARARTDSFFFGSVLAEYEAATGLDEGQVAGWLGCSSASYAKLALCRRPLPSKDRLHAEVQQIAKYVGCTSERLIQLLRLASSLSSLRDPVSLETELLMAARDRKRQDDGSDSSEKE